MTFLQPLLLWGLPLAALPIVIHLIHLYRRRTVKWAAMMFLLAAQRLNKGFSRLRQILILAFRVLALMALVFVVSRPLAGGWLGLTGGAPDTVLILVDRSASMEQQNPVTGLSKRVAGLRNLTKAVKDAIGARSRLVLIDSASLKPLPLERAESLPDLLQTAATDTAADIPAMLHAALDFISRNKTGRTDLWLLGDLQSGDWDASGGRWEALRSAFARLPGVRFRLLCYPEVSRENLGITVGRVLRRETGGGAELLLDIHLNRRGDTLLAPVEVPLRIVVNGTASVSRIELKQDQLLLQAHSVPIDKSTRRGWGRVEVPADSFGSDNAFHFVFDEPPLLHSVIVSADETQIGPLRAALSAPADPARKYSVTVLGISHAAEIPWETTALVLWHAPLPGPHDILAKQLENHAGAGRGIVFLPPETPDAASLFGLRWENWRADGGQPVTVEWWRNDAGLLANTRDGVALPVGELEVLRHCRIGGEGVPLARLPQDEPLLMRSAAEHGDSVHFLGTLPGPGASSLARDGVVMFALLHRALNDGARGIGRAQLRECASDALGPESTDWRPVGPVKDGTSEVRELLPLRAGVVESGEKLTALNRPSAEDRPELLSSATLEGLFNGLDFERVDETLENNRSLTSEVWRTFLISMALVLIGEALLCMPARRESSSLTSPATPAPAT